MRSRLRFKATLNKVIFLLSLLFPGTFSRANIQPTDGATLNYTQVLFEYDEVPGADKYVIVISDGNKTISVKNTSLAYIVSGLEFGKAYSWQYEAFRKNRSVFKSGKLSFRIASSYLTDTSLFRTSIDVAEKGFHNDLVFLDYLGAAIDRQGKIVWYYPSKSEDGRSGPNYRNMRMTREGTITFQDNTDCFEVNIAGKLLWKAPNDGKVSGDKIEYYHHDFRKLDDGTYVAASYQYNHEPNLFNPAVTTKVRYNTLIQYDAAGNVLWYWNEKDHVARSVLFEGMTGQSTETEGTHLNGFDYDKDADAFVMSFRNNSSICRVDKKSGNVIYTLDKKQDFFNRQHGPVILPAHQLLVYNNNASDSAVRSITYPKVMIVSEPVNGMPASVIWEYECRSPRFPRGIIGKEGYAINLPNGNILVCMGSVNFCFEVTREKKIVWEATFERFDDKQKKWIGFNNYRCNFASSLYPSYFTLQHGGRSKSVKVNNEGSDDNSFQLDVMASDGKTKLYSSTLSLKARTSKQINLKKIGGDDLIVVVSPLVSLMNSKVIEIKKD